VTWPKYWRTGGRWGNTIVREGDGHPDLEGRRSGDALVGLALTVEDADFICMCVNEHLARYESSDAV
jgi:hypothetical protein